MKEHQVTCLERFGLTAPQANALWRALPGESVSVGALAERCRMDPSNLNAPLAGLEARGLVERRPAVHDRRVRAVALTEEGVALRKQLMGCLFDEPPVVAGLSEEERAAFRDLLAKVA
jgi:DNA-binding MarR family transcriptional regulator